MRSDRILIIITINVSSITTVTNRYCIETIERIVLLSDIVFFRLFFIDLMCFKKIRMTPKIAVLPCPVEFCPNPGI